MKLKENFTIRKIGDEYMMVSESGSSMDYTRVISLNSSAAYLIGETRQKQFTREEWADLLIKKYGVDREKAEVDVQALINNLIKEKLIDE